MFRLICTLSDGEDGRADPVHKRKGRLSDMSSYEVERFIRTSGSAIGVLAVILVIVFIAAGWRILTKAGDKGWKILIPIYGTYCLYKVANSEGIFWGMFLLSVVSNLLTSFVARSQTPFLVITGITAIIQLFMMYVYCKNMANAFGKGTGFAIGLFLLSPIFFLILAFGPAEYGGISGYSSIPSTTTTWKCPNCGTENLSSRSSCEKCGQYR